MLPIRDVNPVRIRPLITWALVAANVLIFFGAQGQDDAEAFADFLYENAAIACELTTGDPITESEQFGTCTEDDVESPLFPDKNIPLSALVSMFLHGGIAHLGFNMWSLWIFGNNVEEAFGHVGYAVMYAASGIAATAGFVVANPDLTVPLIGASGAIAGVMGSYLVLFPRHLVMTLIFFRIVALPAIAFLGIWFASQFLLSADAGQIAWEAHVIGFVFGALVTLPLRGRLLANTLAGRTAAEASVFGG